MKKIFPSQSYTALGLAYFILHLSSIYVHQMWIYIAYELLFLTYLIFGSKAPHFLKQSAILHGILTLFYLPELFVSRGLSLSNPLSALALYPFAHWLISALAAGLRPKPASE